MQQRPRQGLRAQAVPTAFSQDEILQLLPQRSPFLFIDRIVSFEPHRRIVCLKNVTANEWFMQGHFPGRPIMPGALILEALSQATILLFRKSAPQAVFDDKLFLFGSAHVRFRRLVVPGDALYLEVTVLKALASGGMVEGRGVVAGEVAADAEMAFGVVPRREPSS